MKPIVIWIAGAVVIFAAAIGGYNAFFKDKSSGKTTKENISTGENADAGATKTACDIYTDDIAQQVPGSGAKKGEMPSFAAQSSTDDVSISNCYYSIDNPDPNSAKVIDASVMVRGGKTASGKSSNKLGFNGSKKTDSEGGNTGTSEPISGIGDEAYYSPAMEQVNVLTKDGTYWLIVSAETRAESEQLAKLLAAKL